MKFVEKTEISCLSGGSRDYWLFAQGSGFNSWLIYFSMRICTSDMNSFT